jgi:hypothetical protein
VRAYLGLLETERLDEAKRKDEDYHRAKLTAAALNDPERIWTEHDAFRSATLAPPPLPETDDAMLWRTVQYIHAKNLATAKAH